MPFKDPDKRRTYEREAMRRRRAILQERRRAEVEVARSQRARPPEADCIWAAGMFEGDGTATMRGAGYKGYSVGSVSLTSTDREIVQFFVERWGGKLRTRQPPGRARLAYIWEIGGEKVVSFLDDVLPHVRTSRRRAVMTLVVESQRARHMGKRLDGYAEKIKAYREQVRALNARGVPHDEPPKVKSAAP